MRILRMLTAIVLLVLYVSILNLLLNYNLSFPGINEAVLSEQSGVEKVGVGDGVSVSVKGERLFYDIEKVNNNSRILLFGFVSIPIRLKGFNLFFIHVPLLLLLLLFVLSERRYYGNEQVS